MQCATVFTLVGKCKILLSFEISSKNQVYFSPISKDEKHEHIINLSIFV